MTRWHESSCQAPEIIIEAGTGWPRCRTCRNSAPLENLLDRQPPSDPLLSPPLDEFPGELNLHWLPCVPYFSSPKPAFRPRLQLWAKASQQASKPNYNDSSSTLAPPEISTIYERRLTSNEFRLLRLCPVQNGDDPFHLSLHTYTHDDCPEYETVSYTWGGEEGDSSLCKPIFLGPYWDVLFQTRNCWDMLKLLRPREGFRMVWVDAICINQRDKEEREDQVAKMGRIYEDALRVVVHLGQNLVSPLPPSAVYPSRHKFHQFNDRLPKGPTLKEVLQRKYFSRVWVVQELIISRQALIRIGNVEFVIDQQTSKNIESSLQGLNWANIVAQWAQHIAQGCIPRKSTSLLDMIFLTWNSQASDPRDKVFGILGLLENLTPIVRPDYSISSQHVLIGIAAHCLINLRDIRILSMAPGIRNCGSLPSWVPNPISSELLARRPRLERNTTEQFTLKWQKEAIQKLRDQELSDSALNIVGDTSRLEGRYRHVFWPLVVDKTSCADDGLSREDGKIHCSWHNVTAHYPRTKRSPKRICGWNSKAVVETSTGAVVLNPVHLLQITSRPKLVYSAEDLRVFEIFGRSGTNSFYLVTCDVALDTCVNPKEDHLFLLAKEDSTSLYLVLRRLRKGYSRRFHLVCSCEQLFFRVRTLHDPLYSPPREYVKMSELQYSGLNLLERIEDLLYARYDSGSWSTKLRFDRETWEYIFLGETILENIFPVLQGVLNQERNSRPNFLESYLAYMAKFKPSLEDLDDIPHWIWLELEPDTWYQLNRWAGREREHRKFANIDEQRTLWEYRQEGDEWKTWNPKARPNEPPSSLSSATDPVYMIAEINTIYEWINRSLLMKLLRELNVTNRLPDYQVKELDIVRRKGAWEDHTITAPRLDWKILEYNPGFVNDFGIDGSTYRVSII